MKRKLIDRRTALFALVVTAFVGLLFAFATRDQDLADGMAESYLLGLMQLGELPPAALAKEGGTRVVAEDSSIGRASWQGTFKGSAVRGEAVVLLDLQNRNWQVTFAQYRIGNSPWYAITPPRPLPPTRQLSAYRTIETDLYYTASHLGERAGLKMLDSIVKADPSRLDAYIAAARVHHRARRDSEAEALLRAWLRRNPGSSDALAWLGYLYTTMPGRDADAEMYLNAAVRADPKHEWALMQRALYYSGKLKPVEALRDLKAACGLGWQVACGDTAVKRRQVDRLRQRTQ